MIKVIAFVIACFAFVATEPRLVEDEQGNQYYLTPVLRRERREEPQMPKHVPLRGEYGANGQLQKGQFVYQNEHGSGVALSHLHSSGFGHNVGVDARIPVWSHKNNWGESTLNLGLGASQHYGGWAGDRNLDKRVGLNFNFRPN